ncbi:hypothetical protein Leryth_021814 [Lithospermum erythrorhizon]|nr:hypothetical protein Leryth_021814 [Lithospermum erythrorhizon]
MWLSYSLQEAGTRGFSFDDGSLRSTLQEHENVLECYPIRDLDTLKDNKDFVPRSFVEASTGS